MTRHVVTLANPRLYERAIEYVREARPGSRVEFKGPKRSNDQNGAMWAMLGDITDQLTWSGRKLEDESWKLIFLDALRRSMSDDRQAMDLVPNIDGTGFVDISGKSSSDLEHEEMRDLLTIIRAFGDQHGVVWSEPKPKDPRPVPPVEAYEEQPPQDGRSDSSATTIADDTRTAAGDVEIAKGGVSA
jgi:hypothetical protein